MLKTMLNVVVGDTPNAVYNRTSWFDSSLALGSTQALDPKFDPSYKKWV